MGNYKNFKYTGESMFISCIGSWITIEDIRPTNNINTRIHELLVRDRMKISTQIWLKENIGTLNRVIWWNHQYGNSLWYGPMTEDNSHELESLEDCVNFMLPILIACSLKDDIWRT